MDTEGRFCRDELGGAARTVRQRYLIGLPVASRDPERSHSAERQSRRWGCGGGEASIIRVCVCDAGPRIQQQAAEPGGLRWHALDAGRSRFRRLSAVRLAARPVYGGSAGIACDRLC